MASSDKETKLLMKLVEERYGVRLTEEQLEHVEKSLENVMNAARSLRDVPLENADEPYNVFKPHRRKD